MKYLKDDELDLWEFQQRPYHGSMTILKESDPTIDIGDIFQRLADARKKIEELETALGERRDEEALKPIYQSLKNAEERNYIPTKIIVSPEYHKSLRRQLSQKLNSTYIDLTTMQGKIQKLYGVEYEVDTNLTGWCYRVVSTFEEM